MAKPAPRAPIKKVELYEKLIATNPAVERKGAANPYTSLNGRLFSQLLPSGKLSLRLSEVEREAFLEKFSTRLVDGGVMKEYVEVPDNMLENIEEIKKYFDISYNYAESLKPKRTKRAKAS